MHLIKHKLKSNYRRLFRAAKVDSIRSKSQSGFGPHPGDRGHEFGGIISSLYGHAGLISTVLWA